MIELVRRDTNEYCSALERDFTGDPDVMQALGMGDTPQSMLEAARVIRRKENSAFLKLPVFQYAALQKNIQVSAGVLQNKYLAAGAACIAAAGGETVLFRISGPFTSFMEAAGWEQTMRMMQKRGQEMRRQLFAVADELAQAILQADALGAKIISLADPSASFGLMGEKKYHDFAAEPFMRMLGHVLNSNGRALMHICPGSSLPLQQLGLLSACLLHVEPEPYNRILIKLAGKEEIRLIGHRCINAEHLLCRDVVLLHRKGAPC